MAHCRQPCARGARSDTRADRCLLAFQARFPCRWVGLRRQAQRLKSGSLRLALWQDARDVRLALSRGAHARRMITRERLVEPDRPADFARWIIEIPRDMREAADLRVHFSYSLGRETSNVLALLPEVAFAAGISLPLVPPGSPCQLYQDGVRASGRSRSALTMATS